MRRNAVHDGWTVRAVGGQVPPEIVGQVAATVPGTVHTDLLAAGLIPDPYQGGNEESLVWLHRSSWIYETALEAEPAVAGERVDLVFDGLDTVATVTVDGVELGRTANMHRGYRFDVSHLLRGPAVPLAVRFDSALEYAERLQKELGERPRAYGHPFNAVRKMACSFGWDWGPDLQTCGIWKPVRLERWRVARIAECRTLATLDADGRTGRLTVHVTVERSGLDPAGSLSVPITIDALGDGREPVRALLTLTEDAQHGSIELVVPDAPVWWPAGYGAQPLATVAVELTGADGAQLDEATRRVGFRSVHLDEGPDEVGRRFTLVVNGRDVFALGLNWIPEDHLLTRLTRQDYAAAVDRAVAANANLLRVWGGGIYESDDFYDVCDERGVLVWQDFLLACAAYAEEEPLRSEILAEARENVVRLSTHPSLVLWNGGNENIWGHEDWKWKEQLNGASWGARYYYDDFPAILAELDPTRPYHPGSPSSPGFDPEDIHPNDERYGTRHEWEAWNREDYRWHDRSIPRFCSEYGWQAPPAWATLTSALQPEDLRRDSPTFLAHQKAEDGNGKLDRGLAYHLPVPADFAGWHWATQLNQARATTYAVLHLRAHAPRTMGSILWQLNDCWPVTSWSVVDGAGRYKPAWYALRRAYAPRALTLRERDGELALAVINDGDDPWRSTARLRRMTFDGDELAATEIELDISARSVQWFTAPAALTAVSDPAREVLVADVGGIRAVHLFAEDYDLAYDPSAASAHAETVEGGYSVTVIASSFARDVALLADGIAADAACDDMLVDLLPGETHTFTVTTAAVVDPARFTLPDALRSANTVSAS
jgi:beta-mannosidase